VRIENRVKKLEKELAPSEQIRIVFVEDGQTEDEALKEYKAKNRANKNDTFVFMNSDDIGIL